MDEHTTNMKPIADLFGGYTLPVKRTKKNTSERGELVRYFFDRAAQEWHGSSALKPGYLAMKLAHLTMQDLYAFKSMCEDRVRAGYPWGKYFWGSLKSHAWDKPDNSLMGA